MQVCKPIYYTLYKLGLSVNKQNKQKASSWSHLTTFYDHNHQACLGAIAHADLNGKVEVQLHFAKLMFMFCARWKFHWPACIF